MEDNSTRTTAAWLATLGQRLTRHRLNQNLSQAEVAERAGVSLRTVARLEGGEPTQLESFLRVLAALGLDRGLDRLVPEVPESPIQRLERDGKRRKRATGRRAKRPKRTKPWTWGDSS
jgi:transcriptional regulator with XRE-family HTH domain